MSPHPSTVHAPRQHQELAGWFLRRQEAAWGAADEAAFQHWLDAAPDNRAAYRQWEADWKLIDAMPASSADRLRAMVRADHEAQAQAQAQAQARPAPRRRALAGGWALAGMAGVALLGGWLGWRQYQALPVHEAAYATARGEQREVALPDGSRLRLGPATSLLVAFSRGTRQARLQGGEAVFTVQPDAGRPFRVAAGDVDVTVTGTVFSVRWTPQVPGREGVEVAVQEGRVQVARAGQGLALHAGQRLAFGPLGAPPVRGVVPAEGIAPWREGQLSFSDAPLRQVVAEMQRHVDLDIASIDASVAGMRLSATLDARNAAATRRLLGAALPVQLVPAAAGGYDVLPAR